MTPDVLSMRGRQVVDAMVVLVAVTLTLTVLDDTFATRAYLVAGLVPVGMAIVLGTWLLPHEHGAWAYSILLILLYAPLGALAALRDPGTYVFPDFSAMGRLLGETPTAPLRLVSTLPPVEAAGTTMLVPYALGFAAGALAIGIGLGTSRPVVPVLPLVAALGGAIYLGTSSPDALLGRAGAVAALCLWWVSVRRQRVDVAAGAVRRSRSQPWVAAALIGLVCAGTAVVVPAPDSADRVLLRQRGLVETRLVDVDDPYELAGPRRRELLEATGVPQGTPIRFAALDVYDGTAWVAGERSPGPDGEAFQRIGEEVAPTDMGGTEVTVEVRIQADYSSDWLPTVGELVGLDIDYTDGRTQLDEVRYNRTSATALVLGGVDPRDEYTLTAEVGDARLSRGDRAFADADDETRQPQGAYLDRYLGDFRAASSEPLARLRLFLQYLRSNGTVRLRGASPQSAEALVTDFLGSRRVIGSPHQYGALVALAASRLGVPARLAVGAFPDRRGRVAETDVQSWVEVRVADGSWRRLLQPSYLGRRGVVGPQERPPQRPSDWLDRRDRGERADQPTPSAPRDVDPPAAGRVLGWVAGGLFGLVVLGVALLPLLKVARRALRRRRGGPEEPFVGGWQEVLDTAADVGRPVPAALGLVAQARMLGRGVELARRAESAVFAPAPTPPGEARAFWRDAQNLRRDLLREVSWWRRLRAAFSPASLRPGRAR